MKPNGGRLDVVLEKQTGTFVRVCACVSVLFPAHRTVCEYRTVRCMTFHALLHARPLPQGLPVLQNTQK